jgi:hypothetical protein
LCPLREVLIFLSTIFNLLSMKTFLLSLALLSGVSLWAQGPEQIQARLTARYDSFPQEKIFLHHSKPAYLLGEDLWFKAYLTDAQQHGPSLLSGLAYVELIGPADTVLVRHHLAIRNGAGHGDFALPLTGAAGTYRLRAYTQYMRNYPQAFFFETQFPVHRAVGPQDSTGAPPAPVSAPDFAVQFFPEGGEAVAGLPQRLGIKASQAGGKGITVTGRILDGAGEAVADFQTLRFGLGSCEWRPLPGQDYVAEVTYEGQRRRFDLPPVRPLGYALRADVQGQEAVLTLRSNQPDGLEGAFVLGHLRGQVFCRVEGLRGGGQRLRLPLSELPEGIAHFTLFDGEGRPVAERLIFIHQPGQRPTLTLGTDQTRYGPRQPVMLTLDLQDAEGKPLAGEVSVSVYDQLWQQTGQPQADIRSHLLLSSDLPGPIEEPGYYFEADDPGRRLLLDRLLMTQGWRRFAWPEVLAGQGPTLTYPNQAGISFGGTITRKARRQGTEAEVILTAVTDKVLLDRQVTGERGRFYFDGYQFTDTTSITVQAGLYQPKKARRKRKREQKEGTISLTPTGNRNVDIRLDSYGWPALAPRPSLQQPLRARVDTIEEVLAEEEAWRNLLEKDYEDLIKEVDLEEVVIEGERNQPVFGRFDRPGTLYRNPDSQIGRASCRERV